MMDAIAREVERDSAYEGQIGFVRTAPEPTAQESSPVPELTDRETEILRYVAMGMTAKEIAADLVISHRTVQNHVQNILGKLHLHNRAQVVAFAQHLRGQLR